MPLGLSKSYQILTIECAFSNVVHPWCPASGSRSSTQQCARCLSPFLNGSILRRVVGSSSSFRQSFMIQLLFLTTSIIQLWLPGTRYLTDTTRKSSEYDTSCKRKPYPFFVLQLFNCIKNTTSPVLVWMWKNSSNEARRTKVHAPVGMLHVLFRHSSNQIEVKSKWKMWSSLAVLNKDSGRSSSNVAVKCESHCSCWPLHKIRLWLLCVWQRLLWAFLVI